MGLYTDICAGLVFPLHERLKRHSSVAVRRRLEEQERWPEEQLERWRVEKLREFLVEIGSSVPYYRDLFGRLGFDPRQVSSIADLQRLPFMDKPTMRAAGDGLRSTKAEGLSRYNTGGSSGEPLIFYIGKQRKSHDVGAKWRVTRWWGVDIGDPEIVVWGSPIELGAQDHMRLLRDKLLRTRLLPAFEMSPGNLDYFVTTIRQMRPKMLFGYPSSLALIATHAKSRGIAMDRLGIRVAFVTSERLYDTQRAAISEVFGCPVANGYGARDAGFLAHECPEGGMHLQAEDVIVEIVDADGRVLPPGQTGEIVVTHTATGEYPFVRYRTGDIATVSEQRCSCGRTLPLLEEIHGRSTDFVIAKDGTVMHGLSLIYVVRDLPGVKAFKVIQETLELTRVQLVVDKAFNRGAVATIIEGFKRRLGAAVSIEVEFVDEIPRESSGKYRYIVSRVHQGGASTHGESSCVT